jgi:RNase adaptor protein for sRNA GlmZ degradation
MLGSGQGDQMLFFKSPKMSPNPYFVKTTRFTADFEEQVAQYVIQKYDFEKMPK